MRWRAGFGGVILFLLSGCGRGPDSEFQPGKGEAGAFVLAQVIQRGGQPVATNSLPLIGGEWSFFEDRNGAIVHLRKDEFPAIERFVTVAFGEPAQKPADTMDGGRLGWYSGQGLGAAVQFGYDSDKAYINIIRPLADEEMIEALGRIAEEE